MEQKKADKIFSSAGRILMKIVRVAGIGAVKAATRVLVLWEQPVASAVLALALYAFLASTQSDIWGASKHPYFNYLADAFLHGSLSLRLLPPTIHDLSIFNGRFYLYWPPFPAVILMPGVAVWGPRFSDIALTIVIASLNVGGIALLLRHSSALGIKYILPIKRAFLVLFFATGTVHLMLAPLGRVWFTAQIIGLFFVIASYLSAICLKGRIAFWGTGAALAAAMVCRNNLILNGIWPIWYLYFRQPHLIRKRKIHSIAAECALPIIIALCLIAVYNHLRFGDWLDNGLRHHFMAGRFREEFLHYGAFHYHYLVNNIYYSYLAYPFPASAESLEGGSLFLLSPLFAAAVFGITALWRQTSTRVLLLTIMLIQVPALFLMGTGWMQFGPRYTLDFVVPLLMLTAAGVRQLPTSAVFILTLVSSSQYITGFFIFAPYFF